MFPVVNKKGNLGLVVLIFLVLLVIFISIISNKLHDEVTQKDDQDTATLTEEVSQDESAAQPGPAAASPKAKNTSGKLLRKTIVVRGNDFLEHWFFRGDEVVGKQQINDTGVLNMEGEIPDGRVEFIDTYKDTTGEEYYRDGVRDGNSTTYFADGRLKETAKYDSGKLVTKTEYYTDGRIRFEVDYTDAREMGDDVETGIGKLYYPNEKLKFEWHLTRRDPVGFKKSYNQDGTLRHTAIFDEDNNMIEEKVREPEPELPEALPPAAVTP